MVAQGVRLDVPGDLLPARFVVRPNRFVAHCLVNGEPWVCHVPDPGRLVGVLEPDVVVWVRRATSKGTTQARLMFVETRGGALVCVDTQLPNKLVAAALAAGALAALAPPGTGIRAEVTHARSRFDFALTPPGGALSYLEVKAVSWAQDRVGYFPDAPTVRGRKHVEELTHLAKQGVVCHVLFVGQRADLDEVRPARTIDPAFADALAAARRAGVTLWAHRTTPSPTHVTWGDAVPVVL